MSLSLIVAGRRPCELAGLTEPAYIQQKELGGFSVVARGEHDSWRVYERKPDERTVELLLVEFACVEAGAPEQDTWLEPLAWTSIYANFEWRHLYFANDGYLYYPPAGGLVAFVQRAASHIPADQREPEVT